MNSENRFQSFFMDNVYLLLKNYLYNYLLRKRAISQVVAGAPPDLAIEIGAGISPVSDLDRNVVFTDVTSEGLRVLKNMKGNGLFVVADGTALPFKDKAFSHCIASEVIEHIADDSQALREMSRVLKSNGRCILTFPHRNAYYALDDAYVNHYRRYDLPEIKGKLTSAGLFPGPPVKVLGPLEKMIMISFVSLVKVRRQKRPAKERTPASPSRVWLYAAIFKWLNRVLASLAWLDAKIMPLSMSTVLLIDSEKR